MLDPEFEFSQGSLQDYVDCQRRFQLRYVERQAWPAVEAEPFLEREEHSEQGRRFHRLIPIRSVQKQSHIRNQVEEVGRHYCSSES